MDAAHMLANVGPGVEHTADVARVLALRRRPEPDGAMIEVVSMAMRTDPTVRLRLPQVTALRELFECGGLFAPMRVGSGKTLVTLLAPTLLDAQRPVLMIPASLRDKTRREFAEYASRWKVRLPHLVSYAELGRPDREHRLLELAPDLLILDEAHRAKNRDAACTRRIGRCVQLIRPRVVALSGTLISDQLMDYWHILLWCLGVGAPVPLTEAEAQRWASALDRDVKGGQRLTKGALLQFGDFHDHMRATRGVVPTPGEGCTSSIEISQWSAPLPPQLQETIEYVKETGMRPDGELLDEYEVPDVLSQLALGFWYTWDPLPPKWWLEPRRAWSAWVREVLDQHLDGYDSPSQIVHRLDGHVCDETRYGIKPAIPGEREGRGLLAMWRAVRDQFAPNVVPVWIDDKPLQSAAESRNTLLWCKFRAAGERLQQLGVPYYGGGTDPQSAAPGSTITLSIAAHGTGRNMQAWHRSLVLTPPANASAWEQMIGRTHRQGQTSDVVYVSVINSIDYHDDVMRRVRTHAKATSEASGFAMKLTDATWL